MIIFTNWRTKLWHILTQTYHQSIARLGPSISMTWTCLRKVKRIVLLLVLRASLAVRSYSILCYRMVRSTIVCLFQRFSKNVFLDPKCLICQLTSYNCGIVLVIILAFIALIGWLV